MIRHIIVPLLWLMCCVSTASAQSGTPVVTDSRIKTFVYNENDVFTVLTHYGYQSNIEFGRHEEIMTVSVGDRVAWQIVPAGRRLFVKAMEERAHTNMTVVTNKRSYQFDLRSSGRVPLHPTEELVYVVRFFYPDEQPITPQPPIYSDATPAPTMPMPAPQAMPAPTIPPMASYSQAVPVPPVVASNYTTPAAPAATLMPAPQAMPAPNMYQQQPLPPIAAMPPMAPALPPVAQAAAQQPAYSPAPSLPPVAQSPQPATPAPTPPSPVPALPPVAQAAPQQPAYSPAPSLPPISALADDPYTDTATFPTLTPTNIPMQTAMSAPMLPPIHPEPAATLSKSPHITHEYSTPMVAEKPSASAGTPGNPNYNYTFTGPEKVAPIKIYDDGKDTYFRFQPSSTGIPQFYIITAQGHEIPVPAVLNKGGEVVVSGMSSRFAIRRNGANIMIFNENAL